MPNKVLWFQIIAADITWYKDIDGYNCKRMKYEMFTQKYPQHDKDVLEIGLAMYCST